MPITDDKTAVSVAELRLKVQFVSPDPSALPVIKTIHTIIYIIIRFVDIMFHPTRLRILYKPKVRFKVVNYL